jgi:hypothetical protein
MSTLNMTRAPSGSFGWAEPLICEQVLSAYNQTVDGSTRLNRLVAVHTMMWLSLIDGDESGFDSRRGELARLASEARLSPTEIDRANRAVLLELVLVVVTRFRNSDRVRLRYVERLESALRFIKANRSYTLH